MLKTKSYLQYYVTNEPNDICNNHENIRGNEYYLKISEAKL